MSANRLIIRPACNGWIVEDIGEDQGHSSRGSVYESKPYVFESFDNLTAWLRTTLKVDANEGQQ